MHTTLDFFRGLLVALAGIPGAMRDHWREAHTLSPWLCEWAARPITEIGTDRVRASYQDYKLWRLLGRVSDILLLAIVLLIIVVVIGVVV